jgi:hypothetical protein
VTRADVVRRTGELASNLKELAHRFEEMKKATEDQRDPLDDATLRTLNRVILDVSVRIETIDKVSQQAGRLLDLNVRSSTIPSR